MRNAFKTLLRTALVLSTLSSCGAVEIKDHAVYGDMGKFGAEKVHTLFTDIPSEHIEKSSWDDLRIGMACLSVADFAEIQKSVDTLCARHQSECNYDQMKQFKEQMTKILDAQQYYGIDIPFEVREAFRK